MCSLVFIMWPFHPEAATAKDDQETSHLLSCHRPPSFSSSYNSAPSSYLRAPCAPLHTSTLRRLHCPCSPRMSPLSVCSQSLLFPLGELSTLCNRVFLCMAIQLVCVPTDHEFQEVSSCPLIHYSFPSAWCHDGHIGGPQISVSLLSKEE